MKTVDRIASLCVQVVIIMLTVVEYKWKRFVSLFGRKSRRILKIISDNLHHTSFEVKYFRNTGENVSEILLVYHRRSQRQRD